MDKQLALLEQEASRLELGQTEWAALEDATLRYARRLIQGLLGAKAYGHRDPSEEMLTKFPITEEGMPIDALMELLRTEVDTLGINPACGRNLGYIPGGGLVHSAFGDLLAALSNRYAGFYFSAPGAVRMENMLTRWMASLIGYPEGSAGFLASGGSIASLSAVVTARDAHGVSAAQLERSVVYLSTETHFCMDKALRIAGLGACPMQLIPTDSGFHMVPEALDEAIRTDKEKGLRPWLVVASAGTTNTGSVDPIPALGEIAHEHGLWFHVDGAYGALFILCPEGQAVLRGLDMSDSIVLDPHKTLFLPYGTGALLVKDRKLLIESHWGGANFMRDAIHGVAGDSPALMSPELTRHFRGLRMWLPLKAHGIAPFRAALSEKILLARYFYERIRGINGFEVGPYPDLSIVVYRYVPPSGDADAFNTELTRAIQLDGRVFISSTRLNGSVFLRLAVGSFRTHRCHVDLVLEILQEKAAELVGSRPTAARQPSGRSSAALAPQGDGGTR